MLFVYYCVLSRSENEQIIFKSTKISKYNARYIRYSSVKDIIIEAKQ